MSLADKLSSLYNGVTLILVGAVVMTTPPQTHARVLYQETGMHVGVGDLTILDSHMTHVYQISDSFKSKSSSIEDLKVIGNAFLENSLIRDGSFVGKVDSTDYTTFNGDVKVTTALSRFTDSTINGNLNVDHHGDVKVTPQIELSNTNITGDIVCSDHCYVHAFNSSFNELKNGTLN